MSAKTEAFGICIILNVCIIFLLSSANKCLLKVGAYCAQLEQYQKAIEIYEQVCVHFTFVSSDDLMFVFPRHTSVLNTYYFDGLSVFTEKLMEMWCTIRTFQKFSMQQWRICTFDHCNISDVAEALLQSFKMVAKIMTTLTDCERFCAVQIYIFLHEALLCITIWYH